MFGIDVIDHHLKKARCNVAKLGLASQIKLSKMDFYHLDNFDDRYFDGV